jgi:hypothetical protein
MILPRFIRFRDAPAYLGMDRKEFNKSVRPFVPEYRIGIQGVAFDRLDLDVWADDYCQRSGLFKNEGKEKSWGNLRQRASSPIPKATR